MPLHAALSRHCNRLVVENADVADGLDEWLDQNLPFKFLIPTATQTKLADVIAQIGEWLDDNIKNQYFVSQFTLGPVVIFFEDHRDVMLARLNYDLQDVVIPFHANSHPVIGLQNSSTVYLLQVHNNVQLSSVGIQIVKPDNSEGLVFSSFKDAETYLFEQYFRSEEDMSTIRCADQSTLTELNHNWFVIVRMSNLIAATTRRGAGNTILIHPDDLPRIQASQDDATKLQYSCFNEYALDWKYVGNVAMGSRIFTRPDMPRGKMLIFYSGSAEFDRAAVIQNIGNEYKLFLNKDHLGYGRVVQFD